MTTTPIWAAIVAALGTPGQICAELTGIIFDDLNRDGYRDVGEPGLPGIRLYVADGWSTLTDENGRFRVSCADLLAGIESSSMTVEVDMQTLPRLYEMTTESRQSVALEADGAANVEFGAVLDKVHLTLWEESFVAGQSSLTRQSREDLDKVISLLREGRSDVELFYVDPNSNASLAQRRIRHVEEALVHHWHHEGCHHEIEIHSWAPKQLYAEPLP